MQYFLNPLAILLLSIATTPWLAAAQWGDLKGTFLYEGTAPPPRPLSVTKDQAFCGKHRIVDESLVVGPTGGVRNIIVFLYLRSSDPQPPVHPDYAKSAAATVTMDNDRCRFQPHVTLLRTSQKLRIGNLDAVGHNTKIDCFANRSINPMIPSGQSFTQTFPEPERRPCQVGCNIHGWMNGWLVIKDHPYMAVTDEQGKFTIRKIPAGKWTFQFWHERAGYVQKVKIKGKKTLWKRGRAAIEIKPGQNDLGTITLSSEVFQP